ncbi:MAG: hypothetical protein IMZ61_13610 [Planctomycetes bacterium]|nr:hypothetical protein [Planctomycetota bacterium]
MRYEFKPSFDRSIKSLHPKQKDETTGVCLALLELMEKRTPLPGGIGLKRLQDDFWEIRQGLHNRILFRWRQDLIEFVLAGNHDSIKDFLKNS